MAISQLVPATRLAQIPATECRRYRAKKGPETKLIRGKVPEATFNQRKIPTKRRKNKIR